MNLWNQPNINLLENPMKRPYFTDYEEIIEYVAVGVFGVILAANSLAKPSSSPTNPLLNSVPMEKSHLSTNNIPKFALLK
jgi:hypothetical protein